MIDVVTKPGDISVPKILLETKRLREALLRVDANHSGIVRSMLKLYRKEDEPKIAAADRGYREGREELIKGWGSMVANRMLNDRSGLGRNMIVALTGLHSYNMPMPSSLVLGWKADVSDAMTMLEQARLVDRDVAQTVLGSNDIDRYDSEDTNLVLTALGKAVVEAVIVLQSSKLQLTYSAATNIVGVQFSAGEDPGPAA